MARSDSLFFCALDCITSNGRIIDELERIWKEVVEV
jgi:hypothetical protein